MSKLTADQALRILSGSESAADALQRLERLGFAVVPILPDDETIVIAERRFAGATGDNEPNGYWKAGIHAAYAAIVTPRPKAKRG